MTKGHTTSREDAGRRRSGPSPARRLAVLALTLVAACAASAALAGTASAEVRWHLNTDWAPTIMKPGSSDGGWKVELGNAGDTTAPGPTTVVFQFPAGMEFNGTVTPPAGGPTCVGTTTVTCTTTQGPTGPTPYRYLFLNRFSIGVTLSPSMAPGPYSVTTTVSGGGAAPVSMVDQVRVADEPTVFGVIPGSFLAGAFDALGEDYTQAGGHPYQATTSFDMNADQLVLAGNEGPRSVGGLKDVVVDLPAGFVGNPEALPKCANVGFVLERLCPPEAQVGVSYIEALGATRVQGSAIYNVVPEQGTPAQLAFNSPGGIVLLTPILRPDGNYAISVKTMNVNETAPVRGVVRATLWGVPASPVHDAERCPVPNNLPQACVGVDPLGGTPQGEGWPADAYQPHASTAPPLAFLTNPTECDGQPVETLLHVSNWDDPASYGKDDLPNLDDPRWDSSTATAPALTDCGRPPFDPAFGMALDTAKADAPTGLKVDLGFDQAGLLDPGREAPAHLKKSVVTLPAGVSVNPSGATGLTGCSNQEIGLVRQGNPSVFDDEDPFDDRGAECPDGSTIGTVEVESPLLSEKLTGDVVLGTPESTDPQSGRMFRLFLVLRNRERGLLVKIFGSAVADPGSGQLTATFDENPQLPLSDLHLEFKGGQRGMLATPQSCGARTWSATFTPWTAEHGAGGSAVDRSGTFATSDCPVIFGPQLRAGMSNSDAAGTGTFSFDFSRQDGDQWFRGLTAKLPAGLLASLKGVDLCTAAQAGANACPLGSQIGVVDATAGAGTPFVLERKGRVYLTEGYKGGEFGLAVSVPVEAGPFRGAMALSPIVVRQAIHVDRTTAQVSAVSDPLPLIHHGVPLRVRRITVDVDRRRFMRNPTDCSPKQVEADIVSAEGRTANVSAPFTVTRCAALPFRPRLGLRLAGRGQRTTGRHPGVRAVLRQRDEAGIEKAVVRLPKSLALDPDNAQALCEFEDGTRPDLESHCPEGSIVGRARAVSPLLKRPLVGNVYFVKNVRRSSSGNLIRTLPMIVVALRGEISINLRGVSSVSRGKLVNTFAAVPDAPVSRFNLNIAGGRNGILTVTRTRAGRINICTGKHVAEADFDAHNGKRFDRNIRMKTPCRGFKKKRAAANRKAAAAGH